MPDSLRDSALDYHRSPPGKLRITATKPLANQRDLALAYSPGVAFACQEIAENPDTAMDYTARGNMVAVVTNGTAVLGLGDIGPLAAKPVMEGKAVLFKKFAGIDAIDVEIEQKDPEKLVEIVASLEPSFGAINLEDIKAPECFHVEGALKRRMNIPVFHDDQHGTAIIVGAAIVNWLYLSGRRVDQVKLVCSGAGAAALACLDLLVDLGIPVENITVTDIEGVVFKGRTVLMDPRKERYAKETTDRTLSDVIGGADIFLGLSAPNVLKPDMVARMAEAPLIMALANPTPEIMPEEANRVRPDAVIATGRSDYPNQVNNVLCFPFIFRGALDCGATQINEAMKIACVHAIASLARQEPSDIVANAYRDQTLHFGHDYLIPKPFDPRLILEVAPAVAKAAADSGVATRPIADLDAYRETLVQFVFRSGLVMRPVFARARSAPKRIAYAEGEEDRVLQAVQVVVDDGLAKPILVGRRAVVDRRIRRLGLRLRRGVHFEIVDPEDDPRYADYWTAYHKIMERRGVSPAVAKTRVRTNTSVIAAMMVDQGDADGMVCGTIGRYKEHLTHVLDIAGLKPGVSAPAALSGLVLSRGTYFIADTHVTADPTAEQVAEAAWLAAETVLRFGVEPKVALVSHSNFGSHEDRAAEKMRRALTLLKEKAPDLEVEGEMHADAALEPQVRNRIFPNSTLKGTANLLIMPSMDAANIAYNMARIMADGLPVGPILIGAAAPIHILTPAATVRGIVNISALATVDAQEHQGG